jgi:L-alanine-DL-glutamate epimerase-like enolase superfamily enzyme
MAAKETYEETLTHVRTHSSPTDLRITDLRFADIIGAPMHCILLKLATNQGLVGYGEVRDWSDRVYALMLKDRILGENPCNVDRIFRKIKQFGGHARQGGGVSGIEVALWDLAGKAYGVPVYQMLGGAFRDRVRMYCDTDTVGKGTAPEMAASLKRRMEMGFTFLKMDLGIHQIRSVPGALSAPLGYLDEFDAAARSFSQAAHRTAPGHDAAAYRDARRRWAEIGGIAHPHTATHITQKGLDLLEQFVAEVRSEVGFEVPIAMDHFGHIPVEDCMALARRLERYAPAWLEDMIPWQLTEQYVRLSGATTALICTGEDIYLKEGFRPLLDSGGISGAHPDLLTAGGILETKKIADMAQERGVAFAMHMAESPIACLAAVHCLASVESCLALEYHSADINWWDDLVEGPAKPIVKEGFIEVPHGPGLGIESLNDDVIRAHLHPDHPDVWADTSRWDVNWNHDRTWS